MGMSLDKVIHEQPGPEATGEAAAAAGSMGLDMKNPFDKWTRFTRGFTIPCVQNMTRGAAGLMTSSANGLVYPNLPGSESTGPMNADLGGDLHMQLGIMSPSSTMATTTTPSPYNMSVARRFIHLAIPSALAFFAFLTICGVLLCIMERRRALSPRIMVRRRHPDKRVACQNHRDILTGENDQTNEAHVVVTIPHLDDPVLQGDGADNCVAWDGERMAQSTIDIHVTIKRMICWFVQPQPEYETKTPAPPSETDKMASPPELNKEMVAEAVILESVTVEEIRNPVAPPPSPAKKLGAFPGKRAFKTNFPGSPELMIPSV